MPLDMLTGPSALGSSSVESPFPEKSALYQVVKLTRIDAEEMRCEKLLYIALHPIIEVLREAHAIRMREKKRMILWNMILSPILCTLEPVV